MERDFQLPSRSEALATECMAATSHPLATAAALEILREGGNAVDAAVSAAAVLGVVEACQTGIGGDCFALFMAKGCGPLSAINGSGWTPRAACTDHYLERGITAIEGNGPDCVTVPGAVAAWERLLEDHGTIGLDRALQAAIRHADEGYPITERVARDWAGQTAKLAARDDTAAIFLPGGAAPGVGTRHRQPKLARTLRAIASGGAQVFYRGWIAEDIVATLRSMKGLHTLDDFAEFSPDYVVPISAGYRGHEIWECPPSGQGLTALLMARILEGFDLRGFSLMDPARLHLVAEAARLSYAMRDAVIADPRFAPAATEHVLSAAMVDACRRRIRPDAVNADLDLAWAPAHRDTVFLTVVDRDRNVVALINSIFDEFGSGIVAPASGVLLHSRGSGFVVRRGHPNTIEGRKRPLHTIIPAMLTCAGRAVMSFGVTGAHFQPIGQAQLLTAVIDHGLPVQRAIEAPRIFARGSTFDAERTVPAESVEALRALGHPVAYTDVPLGTAQAIRIDWGRGVLHGAADPRRDGVALGW